MDFSHILKTSSVQNDKLAELGFEKSGNDFFLKTDLDEDFFTTVEISETTLNAKVFEKSSGDEYVLVNVESATGGFVGEIRTKVSSLINRIKNECFITKELTAEYISWIKEKFSVTDDHPWNTSEEMVFRCPNNKWFALIMEIPLKKLFGQSEEKIHVVNLKADSNLIPQLIDEKSIFPAWHMNKKYWITVLLTTVTDFSKLCQLTEQSFNLVQNKINSTNVNFSNSLN